MTIMRRAASTLAAATLITLSLTAAAGGCGGSSSTPTPPKAPAAPGNGAPPIDPSKVCTVGTSFPKAGVPGRGVVGGVVKLSCTQKPDTVWLSTYLYWSGDGEHDMDQCDQYDAPSSCTLAASCKPGVWSIQWILSVDIQGAPGESSDKTTYHTTVTEADCVSSAH